MNQQLGLVLTRIVQFSPFNNKATVVVCFSAARIIFKEGANQCKFNTRIVQNMCM